MQLKELQKSFFKSLHENTEEKELLKLIKPSKTLSSAELLDIYRNSFKNSCIYELQRLYSACCKLIGEDRFYAIAEEYLQKHTPNPNDFLNYYGENFYQTIESSEIVSDVAYYLTDVVKFEWLIRLSYMKTVTNYNENLLQELAEINPELQEKIVFEMPTNAFLFQSNYPIDKIWRWVEVKDVEQVNMKQPSRVFLRYKNQKLQFSNLKEEEFKFLKVIEKGKNFGEIYDTMQDANIISLLPKFVQHGYIANFKIKR